MTMSISINSYLIRLNIKISAKNMRWVFYIARFYSGMFADSTHRIALLFLICTNFVSSLKEEKQAALTERLLAGWRRIRRSFRADIHICTTSYTPQTGSLSLPVSYLVVFDIFSHVSDRGPLIDSRNIDHNSTSNTMEVCLRRSLLL